MPPNVPLVDAHEHSSPALGPQSERPRDDDEISVLDVFVVLAERRRLILLVTGTLTLAGIIFSVIVPARYTALATLLPPQLQSSSAALLGSQLGNNLGSMASLAGGGLLTKNPSELYVSMMKSRTVEDAMVDRFGLKQEYHKRLQSDARLAFEKHSTVEANVKDGLIRVSVVDYDPKRAADLANGYVEQLRSLTENLAIGEASQRRLFFEKQLVNAKDNLAGAEEALKLTEQKTGVIQLDSQARALIESAASLRAQIVGKQVQIQALRTFATDQNSQLVQAEQELESMQAQLSKLGGSEDGAADGLIVPRGKVPQAGTEYIRKFRDVKYYETIFEILARQFEVAKIDEAKQGAFIQVVDSAVAPDKRSFPHRSIIIAGAMLIGAFLGCFLVLAQSFYLRVQREPVKREKIALLQKALSFRR